MNIGTIIFAAPFVLLVLALLLQPVAQRRRENAMWELMKNLRDATDAKTAVETAVWPEKRGKLTDRWWDSYRFWLK